MGGEILVNNESKVAEILNVLYINVVEKTSGIKPTSILDQENRNLSTATDIIVGKYSPHLSFIKIKKKFQNFNPFSLQKLGNNNVYKLVKNIKANKVMGCDLIPLKLVKIVAGRSTC